LVLLLRSARELESYPDCHLVSSPRGFRASISAAPKPRTVAERGACDGRPRTAPKPGRAAQAAPRAQRTRPGRAGCGRRDCLAPAEASVSRAEARTSAGRPVQASREARPRLLLTSERNTRANCSPRGTDRSPRPLIAPCELPNDRRCLSRRQLKRRGESQPRPELRERCKRPPAAGP
jgi:hypothetical protein